MNKKIIWGVVVIVVIVFVSFMGTNTEKKDNETIKVGVIAPLTGPLTEYGEAFRNGIILAQEELKDNKFDFIFEDSTYDSGKAISAFNKLKDFDKVDIVINWGDPTSQAIAPLIKNNPIPFIAVTTIPSVTESSPYVIRTLNKSDDAAEATWNYLRSKNLKKIAIIKLETAYFNNLLDSLIKSKKSDETVEVVDTYLSFSDKDFKTSIVKIKSETSYDTVGVFLAGGQISQFYKQANTIGLDIPTFGTDFFENQSDIDEAGETLDGAVYVNYDVSNSFRKKYEGKFKNASQIAYAGNGYDTVMMLSDIKSADKDVIINTLKQVEDYDGVLGKWNFIETQTDRYLTSPFHVKMIENGEIKTLD